MFAKLPSLVGLRAYLAATGWSQTGTCHQAQVWTFPADADGPGGEVLIPECANLHDEMRWIREAVSEIALVEQRSGDEIVQNIIDSER